MIPMILILVIAVIIAMIIDKPWDAVDFAMNGVFGGMMGAIVVVIYLGFQTTTNIVKPVEQPVQSEPLVNIADTSYPDTHGTIHGSMMYVYGSISTDNQQAFNYYVKQPDGSYKLKTAPASRSVIVYTNDSPRVEIQSYKCERGEIILEAWSISSCKEKPMAYKFYVPEGSITEAYRLGGEE